jgi:hypothetical protein
MALFCGGVLSATDSKTLASRFEKLGGYTSIPNLLLDYQSKLGLDSNEIVLIANVTRYQYRSGNLPYPKNVTLADKMGLKEDSVRRIKRTLKEKGYLLVSPIKGFSGYTSSEWDFGPLWEKLEQIVSGEQLPLFVATPVSRDPSTGLGRPLRPVSEDPSDRSPEPPHKKTILRRQDEEEKDSGSLTLAASNSSSDSFQPEGVVTGNEEEVEGFDFDFDFEEFDEMSDKKDLTMEERLKLAAERGKAATQKTNKAAQKAKEKREARGGGSGRVRTPPAFLSEVADLEKLWRVEMEKAFPDLVVASEWAAQERGQARILLQKYPLPIVEVAFKYVIRNWSRINEKVFKGNALSPGLGMIVKLHDRFFPEAQKWEKIVPLLTERDQWRAEHPEEWDLPDELSSKISKYKDEMQALGLK